MTLEGKRDHLMEKQHMESFKIPKTFHWIRLFPRQHASVNITEVSVSWVPFEIIGLKLLVVKNRLQACKEFYKNNFWISFFFSLGIGLVSWSTSTLVLSFILSILSYLFACVSGETKEIWEGEWEVLLSVGQTYEPVLKEKRDTATRGIFIK